MYLMNSLYISSKNQLRTEGRQKLDKYLTVQKLSELSLRMKELMQKTVLLFIV